MCKDHKANCVIGFEHETSVDPQELATADSKSDRWFLPLGAG